jgi:2-(1,2-epoxy-1,2-dihydrophenyl)acetyl-CoA isomerase
LPEETILLDVADGLARITLNRSSRLNSFNVEMHQALSAALDRVEGDSDVRAVLLTGAGRGFCAGQDLSDRAVAPDSGPVDLGRSVETYYSPLIRRLTSLEMPVVCAVNGVAAGAGANIAFACDIVIAARSARFIQSFAKIGLIPDSGGTWVLPRLAGQARALGLALTGEPLAAEQAEAWGMIWKCVDDEVLLTEAGALAASLAAGPTRSLAATKRTLRTSFAYTLDEALLRERDLMRELGYSADYQEGVAAFTEKRPPHFTGR